MTIFIPRFAPRGYKMAAAAPVIISSYNFVQRQEEVQFCVFYEGGAFYQKLSCKLSFGSDLFIQGCVLYSCLD